jgi:hypothetical protein
MKMERLKPDALLKLGLAAASLLPAIVLFLLFRERPFEESAGFAYLRIGMAIISFAIYMMARYMTGFLRMAKLPRVFPSVLAGAAVLFIAIVGIIATLYGKWWAEYIPHGAIGAYAAWRIRI